MKSAVERRMEIVDVVNRDGKALVEDLASRFNVSTVTIRSDLSFLEKNGYIVRAHGAAISNTGGITKLNVHEKRCQNVGIKTLLGEAASRLIDDGDIVILDSGSTTREIAANISHVENVIVMTNGLDVAVELSSKTGVEVLMTGGALRKKTLSFTGAQAEAGLKNYRFNKVFLGVDDFDFRSGITTHNEQEASLNRLMCEVSDQVIAVADSSKFGKRSHHLIREIDHIDTLVTDSGIPDDYVQTLKKMNINLIIVQI